MQLPQDVLIHIFGFLDIGSLINSSSVCRYPLELIQFWGLFFSLLKLIHAYILLQGHGIPLQLIIHCGGCNIV